MTDRWLTGMVDAAGTADLIGHVQGRAAAGVIAWLNAQPHSWREGISHVTIDLSASYLKAVIEALADAVLPRPAREPVPDRGPPARHPRRTRKSRA